MNVLVLVNVNVPEGYVFYSGYAYAHVYEHVHVGSLFVDC